jgi:predicted membrane protein
METVASRTEKENEKVSNRVCSTAFWFGIVSIFLNFIGIIPLAGIIISIIGLVTFKKEKQKGKWQGVTGLILNSLFMVVNAYSYGHIG